jgi:elongation factor G
MQLPIGSEGKFCRCGRPADHAGHFWKMKWAVSRVTLKSPLNVKEEAEEKRAQLVERIAEVDDDLTVKFLEGEEISIDELKAGLRRAVLAGQATPVFCGSSLRNKGVQPVLDAVIDYLPSPLDIPAVTGTDLEYRRAGRAPG